MSLSKSDTERAREALQYIDAGCPRAEWVKVGMAAKAAGLDFSDFLNWSATGANFKNEADCKQNWKSFKINGRITEATLFRHARDQGWEEEEKQQAGQLRKQHPQVVEKLSAREIWDRGIDATSTHPYIAAKNGEATGLKAYPASAPKLTIGGQDVAGYLMVPCLSDRTIQTIQFISPAGEKLNLPGASFHDGYFSIGLEPSRIYLCEGISQAWACHKAAGGMAIVCFGATRMKKVSHIIREQFQDADCIIVSDKGQESEMQAIAAAVGGRKVEMPETSPKNYDASDFAKDFGLDVLAEILKPSEPTTSPGRIALLSEDELLSCEDIGWRVENILPKQGVAAIFGASGSGKSFLALDALQAIAAGGEWFGHKTTPCPVLYCALEDEYGLPNRVKAYRIRHETHENAGANVRYLKSGLNLLNKDDLDELIDAIRRLPKKPEVIVIDTLNRAASGVDENDSKGMGLIIAATKHLQEQISGLVILVHHSGKDVTKGLRGHSSLHAALDAAIEVKRQSDTRSWTAAKVKNGVDGHAYKFCLEVVTLNDAPEATITSCTIAPDEGVALSVTKQAIPPKSTNQRLVFSEIQNLIASIDQKNLESRPASIPEDRSFVSITHAVEQIRTKLPCEPKRQTERTHAAINGLIERGFLSASGGMLWIK